MQLGISTKSVQNSKDIASIVCSWGLKLWMLGFNLQRLMLVGHMGVLRGDFPVQTPK